MKKFGVISTLLILIPLMLLLSKCAGVRIGHSIIAQKMLTQLSRIPLPEKSRVIYEHSEVGSFIAATGDATDVLAYRVFVTDLPDSKVVDFFASHICQFDTKDIGICRLDNPPSLPSLPIRNMLTRVPEAERSHSYVFYYVDRCEEAGYWDIRGW